MNESILIVDDEVNFLELISEVLERAGFDVITESDPERALAMYRNEWRSIPLMILDIVMPRMSGALLLESCREINPQLQAIVLSGCMPGSPPMTHGALESAHVLGKPLDMNRLLDTIIRELGIHPPVISSGKTSQTEKGMQ